MAFDPGLLGVDAVLARPVASLLRRGPTGR